MSNDASLTVHWLLEAELPVNAYGNIDMRRGIPPGCVHVKGKRLTVTCRALGIECASALVGWDSGRFGGPILNGVVIRAEDEAKLREAIQKRNTRRLTPAQKEERRRKQQQNDIVEFAASIRAAFPSMPEEDVLGCAERATEIGSGRVGRSSTAEDPVRAAVVAYARHNFTDYDARLGAERESGFYGDSADAWIEARRAVAAEINAKLEEWQKPVNPGQNGPEFHGESRSRGHAFGARRLVECLLNDCNFQHFSEHEFIRVLKQTKMPF